MAALNPNLSEVENLSDFTTEDKVILLACRRYMAATNQDAMDFCEELFDLASQEMANQIPEYRDKLSQLRITPDAVKFS